MAGVAEMVVVSAVVVVGIGVVDAEVVLLAEVGASAEGKLGRILPLPALLESGAAVVNPDILNCEILIRIFV